MKVIIAEYSPTWPALFEQEKALLKSALEENENIIVVEDDEIDAFGE